MIWGVAETIALLSECLTLEPGDRGTVSVGARPEPWNVLHVTSWQRDGKCRGQSGTWTQIIAWR